MSEPVDYDNCRLQKQIEQPVPAMVIQIKSEEHTKRESEKREGGLLSLAPGFVFKEFVKSLRCSLR